MEWLTLCYAMLCQYWVIVLLPVVLPFLVPALTLAVFYGCALYLHLHKLTHLITTGQYGEAERAVARRNLCWLWIYHGKLWHGHEVRGIENIPDSGPALILYYHGAIPVDLYYIGGHILINKNRLLVPLGDRFLFKIPGLKILLEALNAETGTVENSINLIKKDRILAIAPGGVREAYFSDQNYEILWGRRTGFARIISETNVPVIPMFTQNHREAYKSLGMGKSVLRWLYEKTRMPIVPLYGGFPVKLRTYIGAPIKYPSDVSIDELANLIQNEMQTFIWKHQSIPGNTLRAACERFLKRRPKKAS